MWWNKDENVGFKATDMRHADGETVFVFMSPFSTPSGIKWLVHDNGEAMFRLAISGFNPESDWVLDRIERLKQNGVLLEDTRLRRKNLYMIVSKKEVESAANKIAAASVMLASAVTI